MKIFSSIILMLVGASSALAQYELDFNTSGQFATDFSSAQPGPVFQSATGGLNNSGALNLSGMTGGETAQQIITFNHAFAGNLPSWSASIFYYGNAQRFFQFGVTTSPAPAIVEGWAYDGFGEAGYAPGMWSGSGGLDGGAFGIGSYDGSNEPVYNTVIVAGGLTTSAAWYKYTFNVTHTGGSNYALAATLTQANVDGSLGAVLANSSLNVANAALAADSSVHLYLNIYDGVAIDNFSTTTYSPAAIPEPSTYAVLAGALMLGLAAWRRRASRR